MACNGKDEKANNSAKTCVAQVKKCECGAMGCDRNSCSRNNFQNGKCMTCGKYNKWKNVN